MNEITLNQINTICTQIAELREQLDQIWVDLKDEYNERVETMSLGGLEYEEQAELITTFLENTMTCLESAEDEIAKINQAYYDEGE